MTGGDDALLAGYGVRRLCAGNAGPMTAEGTNTYVIDAPGGALVVDPGPDEPSHIGAVIAALGGQPLSWIAVTHAHRDHSAGAPRLSAATEGAPTAAFGRFGDGLRPPMAALVASGALSSSGGGEGADRAFVPDRILREGDAIEAPDGGAALRAVSTPGHLSDHLAFALERPVGAPTGLLFTGDAVMAWSTSLVSPPEGDMTAFFETLDRLIARKDGLMAPGHGSLVRDPSARLAALRAHRRAREASVRAALPPVDAAPASVETIAAAAYPDVEAALLPAAARNALAHLLDLAEQGVAERDGLRFRARKPDDRGP